MSGNLLTVSQYAEHRKNQNLPGSHPATVSRAIKSGKISTNAAGLIDPYQADRDWYKNTQRRGRKAKKKKEDEPKPSKKNGTNGTNGHDVDEPIFQIDLQKWQPDSLVDANMQKAAVQARKEELLRRKLAGELIEVEIVKKMIYGYLRMIRDQVLSIPRRLVPILAQEHGIDEQEFFIAFETDLRKELEEISKNEPPDILK